MSQQALGPAQVTESIQRIVSKIQNTRREMQPTAVVGIRRGGEILAKRLASALQQARGVEIPLGAVDITLYRDDGFGPTDWPEVGQTNLPFTPKDHVILLVDDVLFTGRTVRAAVDAILDYGRPKGIQLAVLIDRGWRELPVHADYTGAKLETEYDQRVSVELDPDHQENDRVVVKEPS